MNFGGTSLPSRLSLILILALVSIPFLLPIHHPPIASFYEEWWAFALGITAALVYALQRPLVVHIPTGLMVVPGVLAIAVLIQALSGLSSIAEAALFYFGYLSWAILLMALGCTLAAQQNYRFHAHIGFGCLMGAVLSAVIALAQYLKLGISPNIVFPALNGRIVANLAQPNQLATYLWIGISAVTYLSDRTKLPSSISIFFVVLLGIAAGLTGSRMSIMHGVILLVLAVLYGLRKKRFFLLLMAQLAQLACIAIVASGTFSDKTAFPPIAFDRLAPQVVAGDARIDQWRDTIAMIGERPLTGNGVGNFPWRMVEIAAKAPADAATYPGLEHAHNIGLQLAADFGLPIAGLALLLLVRWSASLKGTALSAEARWRYDALALLLTHSMLEYPLWYANFLGIAALLAGAATTTAFRVEFPQGRRMIPIALGAAVLALIPLRLDYTKLDAASNFPASHTPSEAEWQWRFRQIADLTNHSILANYAYIPLGVSLQPNVKNAADQSYVCEKAMRIYPDATIITRCAVLRQLSGHSHEAENLLTLAYRAYRTPEQRVAIESSLELAIKNSPEAQRLGGVLTARKSNT